MVFMQLVERFLRVRAVCAMACLAIWFALSGTGDALAQDAVAAPPSAQIAAAVASEGVTVIAAAKPLLGAGLKASRFEWVDESGQHSLAQVQAAPELFSPGLTEPPTRSLGTQASLWIRWDVAALPASDAAATRWYLQFPLSYLDRVSVYQRSDSNPGRWHVQSAGDLVPVSEWPFAARYAVFRLDLRPELADSRGLVRVYARVNHVTRSDLPMRFLTEDELLTEQQADLLLVGTVFGALLVLAAACLAQAWVYRDRTYAAAASYVLSLFFVVGSYSGVLGLIVPFRTELWLDLSQGMLAIVTVMTGSMLVRHLSGARERAPRLAKAVLIMARASVVFLLAFVVLPRNWGALSAGIYVLALLLLAVATAFQVWRRGHADAKWLLMAYTPIVLVTVPTILRLVGLTGMDWLAKNALLAAVGFHVPILLVALYRHSRDGHAAQVRDDALNTHDALTGLLAAHFFKDRLSQAVLAQKRHERKAAALYVRLANYDAILKAHGAQAAEKCLLRAVIKLRRCMRESDTLGRVGDDVFGVLMEGVSEQAEVSERMSKLIAAGLMPVKGMSPPVNLIFTGVGVLLQDREMAPQDAHEQLLRGVSLLSPRSKRPIRFLRKSSELGAATSELPLSDPA
jgi:two-component system, sensor histidine kinase LadS